MKKLKWHERPPKKKGWVEWSQDITLWCVVATIFYFILKGAGLT